MKSVTSGLGIERVHVWRGERHVLKDVSLELALGEVLYITGPNGSGKTTLLRIACGLLQPEQGQVCWNGLPIARSRSDYQSILAYASHEPALKADLTALENLRFAVGMKRHASAEELREALGHTGVAACADLPARVLSAGQRRRVAMARILASQASLWILDEPFTNLDVAGVDLMSNLLNTHAAGGGAALVVAHHEVQGGASVRRVELVP